ncbi:WG repeat-containing protein [Chitinophaga sp. Hz27]|uniref:WG repeat-containing protein n=1 Tax=Chitinophaga sp. Hz27 TaxID=3347169 RepID=UPI0035DB6EF4
MKYLRFIIPLLFPLATNAQQFTEVEYLSPFNDLLAEIKMDNQVQYLHRGGLVVIDKLENQGYFKTLIGVKHNAYGAVNYNGKIIAPFKYDEVKLADEEDEYDHRNDFCFVITRLNGKYGAIDTMGNVLCEPIYDEIDYVNASVFKFRKGPLWGWADIKTGRILQAPAYDEVGKSYISPFLKVEKQQKKGLVRHDGTLVTEIVYSDFSGLGYEDNAYFTYEIQGKIGIMDSTGKKITPAIYDKAERGPAYGTFAVYKGGKVGFINREGKALTDLVYTASRPYGNYVMVTKNGKQGILNGEGKDILPDQFDEIIPAGTNTDKIGTATSFSTRFNYGNPGWFLTRKGAAWNVYDTTGKKLLPLDYTHTDVILYNNTPLIVFTTPQRLMGLAKIDGTPLVPARYTGISEGYNSGYSYLDDMAGPQKGQFIAMMKKERIGLFNITTGKEVIPVAYSRIEWQNPTMIALSKGYDTSAIAAPNGTMIRGDKKYGFFTAVAENRIVETIYTNNSNAATYLTDLKGNKLYTNPYWEFKGTTFSRLLMPDSVKHDNISFNDGLLKVWNNIHENLFIDTTGKEVYFDGYSFVGDFYNGLALAATGERRDMRFGIINREKKIIYPITADNITRFDNDLLEVDQDTLKGLIRKDGSICLPLQYTEINKFYDIGYFKVGKNGNYGVVDSTGKEIIPIKYQDITYDKSQRAFSVTEDRKYGILNAKGAVIIPVKYDELERNQSYYDGDGFPVMVKENGWYFYITADGTTLPYRSKKRKGYDD